MFSVIFVYHSRLLKMNFFNVDGEGSCPPSRVHLVWFHINGLSSLFGEKLWCPCAGKCRCTDVEIHAFGRMGRLIELLSELKSELGLHLEYR